MKDLQDTTLAIRIPIYLKEILLKIAKFEGISMSKLIRYMIEFEYQQTFVSSKDDPMGKSYIEDEELGRKEKESRKQFFNTIKSGTINSK
jgi:hypothetical protein